jgi:hypothetical protein
VRLVSPGFTLLTLPYPTLPYLWLGLSGLTLLTLPYPTLPYLWLGLSGLTLLTLPYPTLPYRLGELRPAAVRRCRVTRGTGAGT